MDRLKIRILQNSGENSGAMANTDWHGRPHKAVHRQFYVALSIRILPLGFNHKFTRQTLPSVHNDRKEVLPRTRLQVSCSWLLRYNGRVSLGSRSLKTVDPTGQERMKLAGRLERLHRAGLVNPDGLGRQRRSET